MQNVDRIRTYSFVHTAYLYLKGVMSELVLPNCRERMFMIFVLKIPHHKL